MQDHWNSKCWGSVVFLVERRLRLPCSGSGVCSLAADSSGIGCGLQSAVLSMGAVARWQGPCQNQKLDWAFAPTSFRIL